MEESVSFTLTDANNVLLFWKEFDIDEKRQNLEKACNEMKELKAASIAGRKKLNEITKLFRSKETNEQLEMLMDVLKQYQEEIDQLSRRSKFTEAAFYGLYKSIYDAPDPASAIQSLVTMVTSTSTSQLEIERLKGELAQYDEEFQLLKNQDITIRRLEDQLNEFKEQIEDKVAEEVSNRSVRIQELADARISDVKEMQRASEKRLAAAVESMKQAQLSAERAQNQLFEVSTQAENRISSLFSENSMLVESVERSHSRITELEGIIEQLQSSNTAANSSASRSANSGARSPRTIEGLSNRGNDSSSNESSLGREDVQTLELVVQELKQELRQKEDQFRQEKHKSESALRESASVLSRERENLAKVCQELAERPTREEMGELRRQLKAVTKIAFSVEDEDDDEKSAAPEHTVDEKNQLESMLVGRMKSLEKDLSLVRRECRELKENETRDAETISTLRKSLQTSTALIARLERDLEAYTRLQLNEDDSNSNEMGCDETVQGDKFHSSMKQVSFASVHSKTAADNVELSELLGVDMRSLSIGQGGSRRKANEQLQQAGQNNAQNNMVSILQGQRDRYKERLSQIETTVMELQQQLKAAQESKVQVEADNLALYGKIRYLQSYGGNNQKISGQSQRWASSSSRGMVHAMEEGAMESLKSGIPGLGVGMRGGLDASQEEDIEKRYRPIYEQRMNPFVQFSQHEQQRKLHELSVLDRIFLNSILAVVSNQAGRRFLLVYFGTMHLLVFCILYYNAHYVHYGCDTNVNMNHAQLANIHSSNVNFP